ncbi:MAG: hypothetical protein HUJ22_13275 [Gracilimonas sp.]|uniref:hypothetical protein n=1 Tax=Gracilimonas sp. TaxID=1974203 RepID=UPI0019922F50|nr:hypothetical protein [Gracilimonas sp.]MBD3617530.1 hypothetical protein [Gracilimonas sp.]
MTALLLHLSFLVSNAFGKSDLALFSQPGAFGSGACADEDQYRYKRTRKVNTGNILIQDTGSRSFRDGIPKGTFGTSITDEMRWTDLRSR